MRFEWGGARSLVKRRVLCAPRRGRGGRACPLSRKARSSRCLGGAGRQPWRCKVDPASLEHWPVDLAMRTLVTTATGDGRRERIREGARGQGRIQPGELTEGGWRVVETRGLSIVCARVFALRTAEASRLCGSNATNDDCAISRSRRVHCCCHAVDCLTTVRMKIGVVAHRTTQRVLVPALVFEWQLRGRCREWDGACTDEMHPAITPTSVADRG